MKYAELFEKLKKLTPEQLMMDVVVYDLDGDATFKINDVTVAGEETEDDCHPQVEEVALGTPYLEMYD